MNLATVIIMILNSFQNAKVVAGFSVSTFRHFFRGGSIRFEFLKKVLVLGMVIGRIKILTEEICEVTCDFFAYLPRARGSSIFV